MIWHKTVIVGEIHKNINDNSPASGIVINPPEHPNGASLGMVRERRVNPLSLAMFAWSSVASSNS